ncbi:MAG: type II toxin-antitoxin system Phd/YefM family antitoxin [Alphaproteobacteria bacterium]|nr:type II toxin-antitoxin system Phd/YefM family antitoxin [Alphaproteobacteria bacterium]
MSDTVSAAEANRKFSELLRKVRSGRSYIVTSHGNPVARIVPAATDDRVRARAREKLFARLSAQKPAKIGRWTRDELYD